MSHNIKKTETRLITAKNHYMYIYIRVFIKKTILTIDSIRPTDRKLIYLVQFTEHTPSRPLMSRPY